MKDSQFDMLLVKRTAELVKHYGIKFDRQVLVPTDDDMVDRLYQAALDLFVEAGVYNMSTERRILFSRGEVEEAIAHLGTVDAVRLEMAAGETASFAVEPARNG
jgi:methylamine--corrinoid protein Co-methyltransferase